MISGIEWYHNEKLVKNDLAKYFVSNNSLMIKNVRVVDQGDVRCTGHDAEDNTTSHFYHSFLYVRGEIFD